MKKCAAFAVFFALAVWTSIGSASIVSVDVADDGDGVITCTAVWENHAETLSIDGVHHRPNGFLEAGHVLGTITTDSELDPNINVSNTIDNDTGVGWIGYHVNVSMDHPFTLSNATVTIPGDWAPAITSQPVLVGTSYVGQLDYTGGTVVKSSPPEPTPDTLQFGYRISFSGYTNYSYCQELIPVPVPEPTSLVLVTCGVMGLFALRRRSA